MREHCSKREKKTGKRQKKKWQNWRFVCFLLLHIILGGFFIIMNYESCKKKGQIMLNKKLYNVDIYGLYNMMLGHLNSNSETIVSLNPPQCRHISLMCLMRGRGCGERGWSVTVAFFDSSYKFVFYQSYILLRYLF